MKRVVKTAKTAPETAIKPTTKPATTNAVTSTPGKKSADVSSEVQGEGDYESAQRYTDSVRSFVESGKVAEAVKKAKPETPEVQKELESAEKIGVAHSKGEDPGVKRKSRAKP